MDTRSAVAMAFLESSDPRTDLESRVVVSFVSRHWMKTLIQVLQLQLLLY